MDNLISEIIKHKLPCYFISPHLDDAVLSAGGLMSYLSNKTDVTMVSIFTVAGEKPYTHAAKGFLKYCGYTDADQLFADRRIEDRVVAEKLGIKSIHLGFTDGSFRRKDKHLPYPKLTTKYFPELEHTYPLGRIVFKLAKDDKMLAEKMQTKLRAIVKEPGAVVFCPIGTVKHMDHLLTKNVCVETFDDLIFWTDYPYIQMVSKKPMVVGGKQLTKLEWTKNMKQKEQLVQLYKTQIKSLLTSGSLEFSSETYWK